MVLFNSLLLSMKECHLKKLIIDPKLSTLHFDLVNPIFGDEHVWYVIEGWEIDYYFKFNLFERKHTKALELNDHFSDKYFVIKFLW